MHSSLKTSATYLELTLSALERVGVRVVVDRSGDGDLHGIEIPAQMVGSFDVEIEADAVVPIGLPLFGEGNQ